MIDFSLLQKIIDSKEEKIFLVKPHKIALIRVLFQNRIRTSLIDGPLT